VNAIAIGTGAIATGSVAVGASASAANGGAAFGDGATATGSLSAALGPQSSATAANSVAIGSNSVANTANTVSVGSVGNERRITNIAPGTGPTDAVNVGQFNTLAAGISTQISGLNGQIDTLRQDTRRGLAASAALALPMAPSAPGKTTVSVASGFYGGQTGIGVSVAHRLNVVMPIIIHGGIATAGGNAQMGRLGAAFEF
jgi:autotransporter adhesin